MKDLLQEIKMLQGVLGVFVFTTDKGIAGSDVPPSFREPALLRMGKFSNSFFGNRVALQQNFSSFEVRNDESLLLLKKIDDTACLITICEPTVSMPLVNMTTSMLLAELKTAVSMAMTAPPAAPAAPAPQPQSAPQSPPATAAPQPAAPQAAAGSSPVDIDKLMNEGPFAAIARKLEDAMSRAIGPVGTMVVRDSVEKWIAAGAPSKNRFNELMGLLIAEIGDTALEDEFRKEVGSLLQ